MHYLVYDKRTRKCLCKSEQQYKAVHFFFDYRAGGSTANSELGLMKCALSQLCDVFPDIERSLGVRNLHDPLLGKNTLQLLEVFCSVLNSLPNPICAFIDGLDEYTGSYAGLAAFFATLQDRTSIKLCLASRPEAAFKTAYGNSPGLAMQDHNSDSVKAYIDYAMTNAQNNLVEIDTVIDSVVRRELQNRAQGVMIWLRLATDELVKVAATGASRARISEVLDDIPEDLEQMYARMFLGIPPTNAQEAAMLLFLINELDGAVDLQILYGLWSFYEADVLRDQNVNVLISQESFEKRFRTLVGSFVDIFDSNAAKKRSEEIQRLFSRYMWTREKPYTKPVSFLIRKAQKLKFRDKALEVRLIHRTLGPFLRHSELIKSFTPHSMCVRYPDNAKSRVYADMIAAASNTSRFDLDRCAEPSHTIIEENCSQPASVALTKILACVIKDEKWKLRIDALIHCVTMFPKAAYNHLLPSAPIYSTWRAALRSPLMALDLKDPILFRRAWGSEAMFLRYGDCIDLAMAIHYRLPQYISEASELESSASPETWHELLEFAFYLSYSIIYALLGMLALPHTASETASGHLQLADIERLVPIIVVQCSSIPRTFLELFPFLMYCQSWSGSRRGLGWNRLWRMAYATLTSMLSMPVDDSSATKWRFRLCCASICHCPRKQCYTAVWACHSHVFQEVASERNLDVYTKNFEQLFAKIILENIDGNGVNSVCETCGTALHAIILKMVPAIPISRLQFLSTLIALAKSGADPNIQHQGKTPLQLLESFKRQNIPTPPLLTAVEILRYHQTEGSWPDFEPIIKKYDLTGPALWKFDGNGKIILDPVHDPKENSDRSFQG
ncbi:hypothetical protein ES702_01574 [subsurface metagenome]